jgi:hypothetical protein
MDIIQSKDFTYIILGIAVLFWLKGSYRMIDRYFPDTVFNNILMILFAISLIYIMNGSLRPIGYAPPPDSEAKK